MNEDHLRISDAEREQAAAALGEHYAQGRLTADEHGDRLDRIWAARTRAELRPVFADLPGPRGPVLEQTSRAGGPPSWSGRASRRRGLPGPLVVVLVVLVALTALTHLPFVLAGVLLFVFLGGRRRQRFAHGYARRFPRSD